MRIDLIQPDGSIRVVLPRNGDGTLIAADDANDDTRRDLAADLLGACVGLSDRGLAERVKAIVPSSVMVAESDRDARDLGYSAARRARIKGTRQGRGKFLGDVLVGGTVVSFKLLSNDKHKETVLTTPSSTTADAVCREIAAYHATGGRIPLVVVAAEALHAPKASKHYRINTARVAWHIVYPLEGVRDLAQLLSQQRGAGRPKVGEVLPNVWATHKDTDCIGGSYQILGRVRGLDQNGWTFGTLDDLKAAVLALG